MVVGGLGAPAKSLPPAPVGITVPIITTGSSASPISVTKPVSKPKPVPKPAPKHIGGIGLPVTLNTPQDIAAAEVAYHSIHGTYFQVLKGNLLPQHESGSVKAALGTNIDTNTIINTYSGPYGDGFQVITIDSLGTHAVGYGPEAKTFTYESLIPKSATSTP